MPKTHGLCSTPMHHVWTSMKARCYNPNNKSYKNYGGRGIAVCDEWVNSYEAFYKWSISSGYQPGLTIERIDNDKGYSPENCKWADRYQQAKNRRSVVYITCNGKTQCMTDWSKELGIPIETIRSRLKVGRSISEAFDKTDWRKNNGGRKKKTD